MAGERGRPRSFDMDRALAEALKVFWRHGFQGASLHDLTAAMGLSKPSLYAAFGDKEALYLKALERYVALLVERHGQALQAEADGRRALAQFLTSMAGMLADPALPGGCFIITGTADLGGCVIPAAVDAALRTALAGTESMLTARLARARDEGDLRDDADIEALSAMFMSLVAGMAVMAKGGTGEAKLHAAIGAAMAAWPARATSA